MTPGAKRPSRQLKHPPEALPTAAALIRELGHPLRRQILEALHEAGEARSSKELAATFNLPIANVSYHVKKLRDIDALVLTDSVPVRGTTEWFHASAVQDHPWLSRILDATHGQD